MRHEATLPARDVPLKIAPRRGVCLLPSSAASSVADGVRVTMATRWRQRSLRIAVDIGTNGEVILGSRAADGVPARPARPRGSADPPRHRGCAGRIDALTGTNDITVHTIGEAPPLAYAAGLTPCSRAGAGGKRSMAG